MAEAITDIKAKLLFKLEILFSILKKDGFQLTTDNYADLLSVTMRLNPGSLSEIASTLCPIVATNDREQARFYELVRKLDFVTLDEIGDFYKISLESPKTVPELDVNGEDQKNNGDDVNNKNKWLWIWVTDGISIAIFLLCFFKLILPPIQRPEIVIFTTSNIKAYANVQKGEALVLDASGRVPEGLDTSKLNFSWHFGGNQTVHGFHAKHVFHNTGDTIIGMEVQSDKYTIKKTRDEFYVHVCSYIPQISSFKISSSLALGDSIKISAITRDKVVAYKWTIDDSVHLKGRNISYFFKKEGYHPISCLAVVDDSACNGQRDTTIEILDKKRHYAVAVTGHNTIPQLKMHVMQWVPFFIWGFAAVCVSLLIFTLRKRATTLLLEENGASRKSVFEVPFMMNDLGIIQPGEKILKMLRLMRQRADEEILILNIPLTLNKTIRNKGVTDLVFNPRQKFQDYLVLIDMENPHGSFGHLFSFLTRSMIKMDVRLSLYYFDRQFYCKSPQSPARLTLQQLVNNYPNSLLIMMGDGHSLLYSLLPFIKNKLLGLLSQWETRMIITPLPQSEWGHREIVLAKYFLISSADEEDMLRLIEKIHLTPEQQEKDRIRNIGAEEAELGSVDDAFNYLGNNPRLTQWLCALAVYPKFRWELLTTFGSVLAKLGGSRYEVSYQDVLALSRVSWLRQGNIPSSIRLELLKRLELANEIAVRIELVKMLEQASLTGSGFYYDNELEDQLIINKFILYAYNPVVNKRYAIDVEKFRDLWQKGQLLDASLRLYLENKEEKKWASPLNISNKPVGLAKYLDKINKKWTKGVYYVATACFLIISAAFVINRYLNALTFTQNTVASSFFSTVPNQLIDIKYKLKKNTVLCNNADSSFVSDLTGNMRIGTKFYPIQYSTATQTISIKVPYEAVIQKKSGIILNMDSGNPSYAENNIPMSPLFTNGTITFSCAIQNDTESIVPPKLPQYLSEIWQGGTSNRLINIKARNRVIYYSINEVNTYGTYGIDEIQYIKPNVYKIITKTTSGYKLFFIKNPSPISFELSVCQGFSQNKNQLESKDTSYCEHFNKMHLYYLKDQDKIFYPTNNGSTSLVFTEINKLNKLSTAGNNYYNITHYKGLNAISKDLSGYVLKKNGGSVSGPPIQNMIANPSVFQRDYDIIANEKANITGGYSSEQTRILWIEDDPSENNQAEIDYFKKYKIEVDVALTNDDAYKKLNTGIYAFLITDIGRAKAEPCVTDITKAGVEFVENVNFPKANIIVYSPAATIEKNKSELLKNGMTAGNLTSDPLFVRNYVLDNLKNGNILKMPQNICPEPVRNGSKDTIPIKLKDTLIKNTFLSYIGLIGKLRSRINVNTPLKTVGIDLNLNSKPNGDNVSFHYSITAGACAGKQGDANIKGTAPTQIFSECGVTLRIQILKIVSGKVYFNAAVSKKTLTKSPG